MIMHAALVHNLLPHPATGEVPWTGVTKQRISLENVPIFGASCTVCVPHTRQQEQAIWLGMDPSTLMHRVLLHSVRELCRRADTLLFRT